MERVSIYIDGGNFYHLVLRKLGLRELNFDFDNFANFLAGNRKIITEGKRFYIGTVREKLDGHENKQAMINQTTLFDRLITTGNWQIKTSKLRTRVEKIKIDNRVENYEYIQRCGIDEIAYTRSREKGIDVKLAVDVMVGAIDDKYDLAIIVSSDTDLVPAIDWVRSRYKNKKIEYIGFSIPQDDFKESTAPTPTLIKHSDIQRVLTEPDLNIFITKNLFSDSG
jgi:uncharacterized LabA/DUF88 family protein